MLDIRNWRTDIPPRNKQKIGRPCNKDTEECAGLVVFLHTVYFDITWPVQNHMEYLYKIDVFTLDAGPLARCQCSEGPATDHLDTGFSFLVSLCLESKC